MYPYFLPCIAAASMSISAFFVASLLLKETLPPDLRKHRVSGKDNNIPYNVEESKHPSTIDFRPAASAVVIQIHPHIEVESRVIPVPDEPDSAYAALTDSERPTLLSLLIRRVVVTIVNYAFLAFIDQCMVVLQPLMYSSSIPLGGLGFSSFTIGIILGVWGIINGIISIFAFPKVLHRFGVRMLYIVAFASYLVCLVAFPVMSVLAKRSGSVDAKVWTILILQLSFYVLAYMGYGCIFLYINDGAPKSALGALNGLAQMTASTMRALAPSTASSLFSVSLERDVVRGNMVYMVLCTIVIAGICASYQLPGHLRSQEAR